MPLIPVIIWGTPSDLFYVSYVFEHLNVGVFIGAQRMGDLNCLIPP